MLIVAILYNLENIEFYGKYLLIMKLTTLQHDLLSETYFKVEMINIGEFWPPVSKMALLEESISLQELPIIYVENEKYNLVNNKNYILEQNLLSININLKTPALIIIQSDLSLNSLSDIFWIDSLKYMPVKKRYDEIIDIIVSDNYLLTKLCPNIISQVNYINRFIPDKISSRKLAEINKLIDIKLSTKRLISKGFSNIEIEQLKLLFINKNKKIMFLDFINIFNHLSTLEYNDIEKTLKYFDDNNLFYTQEMSVFEDLIHRIIELIGNKFTYTTLIKVLNIIDRKKKAENKDFHFINDTLKNPDMDINQVVKFICKQL